MDKKTSSSMEMIEFPSIVFPYPMIAIVDLDGCHQIVDKFVQNCPEIRIEVNL